MRRVRIFSIVVAATFLVPVVASASLIGDLVGIDVFFDWWYQV